MEYRNILIIKMSSLGDVLHTLPFAAVLRKRFPGARLTWLVHPQFGGFVPDKPLIDEVIYWDKAAFKKKTLSGKLRELKNLRDVLRSRCFDLVIDMQGLFKSALMAALTGCPNRIGYAEMREGSGLVSRAIAGAHRHDHVIERYLDVARYLGCEVKEIEFPLPDLTCEWQTLLAKAPMLAARSYVVLAPGARWETKRWPAENFSRLASLLLRGGKNIALAGGAGDAPLGTEIARRVKELTRGTAAKDKTARTELLDLTGRTSLRELGALIAHAEGYISADTGPLFIAAALKKPLVALYGPTRAERTGPYGSELSRVLLTPASCGGCLKKHCADWHCMTDITPQMVYDAYAEILAKEGERSGA